MTAVLPRSLAPVVAAIFMASQVAAQPQGPAQGRGFERGRGPELRRDVLAIPVVGTSSTGGAFRGTLSVQRFASSHNQIVAVALITGTVVAANGSPVGTLVNGPVEVPVEVSLGVSLSEAGPPDGVILAQQTCGVLHIEFGPITINALGLVITISQVVLDLSGETGGTNVLGTLICQILAALTNVATLVGLLNQLLGLLGGLTGGLTL
jgi:hypothetical protein